MGLFLLGFFFLVGFCFVSFSKMKHFENTGRLPYCIDFTLMRCVVFFCVCVCAFCFGVLLGMF